MGTTTRTIGRELRQNYRHGSIELVSDGMVYAGIIAAMFAVACLYVMFDESALVAIINWWRG